MNNWLVRRWRQSLELRIVATTLVASAIVVALLGLVVLDQVKRGMLDAKTRVAIAETTAGIRSAEQQFESSDGAPGETNNVLATLAPEGGSFRSVVVDDPTSQTPESVSISSCDKLCAASVPLSLKNSVTDTGRSAYVYTLIRHDDGSSEPGLVVGAVLNANNAGNAGV